MLPEHAVLEEISRRTGGAFYVFDDQAFRANYLGLRNRLRRHWPNTELAYAMKANYMPTIGRLLAEMAGWAEVVSRFEYEIARASLPAERIIFNGPIKREAELRAAIASGSQVNLDSFREIALLQHLALEFDGIRVGVRVCLPMPQLDSRFGFELESGEFEQALQALRAIPNLEVVALHCHATRRQLGVADPVERIERLCALAVRLLPHHPIESINIGGGLLGELPTSIRAQFTHPVPSLDDYADAIGEAFIRCSPSESMRLIVEPGTSMVANTMCLVAPVMEVRRRCSGWQALVDTGINSLNATRSTTRPSMRLVKPGTGETPQEPCHYRLVGNTCMEHDVICEDFSGHLEAGDFIVFENRGAYSLNYTPPFIVPCPAVVDQYGRLLKHADTPDTILANYCQDITDDPEETVHGYPAVERRTA